MDQNYAMVDSSNIVENITIWDGNTETWAPPSDVICVAIGTDNVGIGMTYNSSGVGVGTTSGNKWIFDQGSNLTNTNTNWPSFIE